VQLISEITLIQNDESMCLATILKSPSCIRTILIPYRKAANKRISPGGFSTGRVTFLRQSVDKSDAKARLVSAFGLENGRI
jgi:hypothetical protein